MQLSLITPVAHLKYTALLPGRFCIAPIAAKHKEYREYFKNAAIDGYKVILDNGVFENDKLKDNAYIDLACEMQPKVLVIPDTINAAADKNWVAALAFIELANVVNGLGDIELMFVPQCKMNDDANFWSTIECAWGHENIQWIGICRDAVRNAFTQWTHTEDQELNRFYFAAELQKRFSVAYITSKYWHFLGVGNRWDLLQYYWFVDSMDTASLFYQSTLDILMTEEGFMPSKLKRPPDYFSRDFSDAHWSDVLEENCKRALLCAQQATISRKKILGGRL